jgi:RND family efflux transporter MFP subunit
VVKTTSHLTLKLFSLALLLSLSTTACKGNSESANAGAPPPLPVKVQPLKNTQVEDTSEFVGTLEAIQRMTLQPQIQGRIEQIFVSDGDRVQKGTPIISLSPDQTEADVASAQAQTNSSRAALGTAQAQLQAAEAERAKAAADLKLQQIQFTRTQTLVAQGAQAQQQLDIAQNNLDSAIATLNAAEKQVNASQAAVRQAEANVRQAQANTASTSVNLKFKQVVAPIAGEVGDFPVKVGDYVTTGQNLTTIIQNDFLDMRISVPANYSSKLRQGTPVQLIDPNTQKPLVTGSINFVSSRVDSSAQGILIKARFPNQSGALRDGQYVRAKIIWDKSSGVLVPTTAVTRIGSQSFVFVVEQENKGDKTQEVVHQRAVKLGPIQGDSYQVIEGVKVGDRLAVSNILKLRDGAPVQPES